MSIYAVPFRKDLQCGDTLYSPTSSPPYASPASYTTCNHFTLETFGFPTLEDSLPSSTGKHPVFPTPFWKNGAFETQTEGFYFFPSLCITCFLHHLHHFLSSILRSTFFLFLLLQ